MDLNEAECYVLEQVEKGMVADLEIRFNTESDRALRSDFLKKILTGSMADLKVTDDGVIIRNAFISEALDLKGAKIPFSISLFLCTFEEEVNFSGAQFSAEANFFLTEFSAWANFANCKFRDSSDFKGCYYHNHAFFNNVTGFSNMQMEWFYDPDKSWPETDEENIKRRGLKKHLKYNETFYIALIKNYRDMGWFREADDCYYTYRVEKRMNRLDKLNKINKNNENIPTAIGRWWNKAKLYGEYALLDWTFGYGVKPLKLLTTYIFLWFVFVPFYFTFLKLQYQYGKREWFMDLFEKISRATVHSVDTLTPGINLYAFTTLTPYYFDTTGYKKILLNLIVRFQQVAGWYLAALFLILFSRIWIR